MYCLVSGSDQIWNTYHRFNPKMFLDFGRDVKRVSYASSIGTHDVNPVYEYEMRCLLKPYRHISLRENAGVVAVSRLTGRDDIRRVQDPTLLMDCDDWRRIAGQESLHQEGLPKRFLLCYLLSENSEYQKQLRDVSNRLSIRDIIIIPSLECPNFSFDGATRYVHATPSEFVQLIDKAVYVCTDSFHATVLSMILSKQFVEFIRFSDGDKTSQNTRIYELLNRYGLDSRIYCAENYRWSDIIEYGPILRKLAEDRAESLSYLKHIIAE